MHVPFPLQCPVEMLLQSCVATTSVSRFLSKIVWSGGQFSEHAQEMPNKTWTFLVATTHLLKLDKLCELFFFWMWEEKVKCLRRRVVLKRNFHLKGSECIRAEFAVVSCSVALEQCNCARTCKDLAQEMSLLEQPIYRSIFSSIRVISEGKC